MNDDTPMMKQWRRFKDQHPNCVLFFRMGDFYETFHEDAELAHRVLGITITRRGNVAMAGVPYHAIERYLTRMIVAGHRCALCNQVEQSTTPTVERDMQRAVTPGRLDDQPGLFANA